MTKTLDEVIKALEYCLNPVDNFGNCNAECPYIHCCDPSNHDVTEDALHYLKEYREKHDDILQMEEALGYCEISDNPPLTWNELENMEGKPVWVEADSGIAGWWLVDTIFDLENDILIGFISRYGYIERSRKMQGICWQAYRKEKDGIHDNKNAK